MGASRLAIAIVLLVLAGAGAAAVLAWQAPQEAGDGAFPVLVRGPEGALFEGVVEARDATALSLLEAACASVGLAVEQEEYPGMGVYVRAVGGHRAAGASGWVYEVERDGAWLSGDRSAALFGLAPGEALRWSWTS